MSGHRSVARLTLIANRCPQIAIACEAIAQLLRFVVKYGHLPQISKIWAILSPLRSGRPAATHLRSLVGPRPRRRRRFLGTACNFYKGWCLGGFLTVARYVVTCQSKLDPPAHVQQACDETVPDTLNGSHEADEAIELKHHDESCHAYESGPVGTHLK